MKKTILFSFLLLLVTSFLWSCSNEPYSPTASPEPEPPVVVTDTVVVVQIDTVYVVVNDTIVDTIYQSCDSSEWNDCKELGKAVHTLQWFGRGLILVVGSDNPHAFGHPVTVCITISRHDGEYDITLTCWRDQVKPGQTLDVYLNGQYTQWLLGQKNYSTLLL